MSLLELIAQDAADVLCNTDDFGEAADYQSASLASGPLRVRAIFGAEERDTERHGLYAHWRDVSVPLADLTELGEAVSARSKEAATLTRLPDDLDAAEAWTIATVRRADGLWHFECFRLGRAAPGAVRR